MIYPQRAVNGKYVMIQNGLIRSSIGQKMKLEKHGLESPEEEPIKGSGMDELKEKLMSLNIRNGRLNKQRSISFSL